MTITEVSKRYNITVDTLRYYERIGLLPSIPRTSGGIRNYSEGDCGWVEFIKCMRSAGVSVEALIEYVNLFHQGDETVLARKKILEEQREKIIERIQELNDSLARLNCKLDGYEERMVQCEKNLK